MRESFIRGAQPDLRDLLLRAGVGESTAVMSIPYMNFLPLTADPYAQGVIQLAEGLQRLLNEHGARLAVDGGLGQATTRAISFFSGPRWAERTWAQLYADALSGKKWAGYVRRDRTMALPPQGLGTSLIGDVVASPIGVAAAVALGIYLWRNR